jgi:hypothetical protein
MAMGDGRHMLPMKAEIRRIIGKEVGETVTVRLDERLRQLVRERGQVYDLRDVTWVVPRLSRAQKGSS